LSTQAPRPIVIFGATSQARLAAHFFATDTEREPVAFTVDEAYLDEPEFSGRPVVAFEKVTDYYPPDDYDMFVALGYTDMNRLRASKYEAARDRG